MTPEKTILNAIIRELKRRGDAMTPEKTILNAIIRELKRLEKRGEPIFWLKVHGSPMQRAGVPDLLILYDGHWIALEVKAGLNTATTLQQYVIARIRKAGGQAAVVYDAEQAISYLREIEVHDGR